MKIWLVTEDTYEGYGTEETCYGFFSTKEKAEEVAKKHKYARIDSYEVDIEEEYLLACYYE